MNMTEMVMLEIFAIVGTLCLTTIILYCSKRGYDLDLKLIELGYEQEQCVGNESKIWKKAIPKQ